MSLKAMIRAVAEANTGATCKLDRLITAVRTYMYFKRYTPLGPEGIDDMIENAYENAVTAEDNGSVET